MSVALKNDGAQARRLVGNFDFAIVEQCFQYHECGLYKPFVKAGKAVYEAEYEISPRQYCARARQQRFSAIRKSYDLFARPRKACRAHSRSRSARRNRLRRWRPAPATSWQWQIVGHVGRLRNVEMYDVDLEDAVPSPRRVKVPGIGSARWPAGVNANIIDRLHSRGIVAVCYLDSGAWESYRPDAGLFPRSVIGRSTGWSGERWLDIRRSGWKRFAPIIWARLRLARSIGCDGVEPDENNPLGNAPGFRIGKRAEARWYLKVAREAHAHHLSVGMKNGVEVIDRRIARAFDWSLNEECFYYHECGRERPFIDAGKAVFQTEYTDDWKHKGFATLGGVAGRVCATSRHLDFSTLAKRVVPDSSFVSCAR